MSNTSLKIIPNFLTVLASYRKLVWPVIETYLHQLSHLPAYCALPSKYDALLKLHIDLVSDYPRRQGKYLRPTLLLLTAQAMGVTLDKALITAAAMQMSEDWILNHDDIEDESLKRRGSDTLHRLYGNALAINAGDALHVLMWKVLIDNLTVLGVEKSHEIFNEFYQMLNRTTLGQTIDIKWNQDDRIILTDEDVFLTLESKTGYYTIAGPMRLGAILAGATDDQLDMVYRFGVLLGRSFQIIDDLLDLTSDFSGLKKQQGNDIYENKKTIMLVHLIRSVKADEKLKLGLILSKKRGHKTPEDVEYVIKLMNDHGSIDYGRRLADEFAAQSVEIFETQLGFIAKEPFRSQLKQGIDFIVHRRH